MSTISDVARRAGVSAMTVSRVVNGSGAIAPATRARVEAAIAELGYVPNALGRQLRSKRTQMVGLVLSDITNPFFTTVARGVEDRAREAGYHILFCDTDESEAEEQRAVTALIERQVDGILLVPTGDDAPTLPLLANRGLPVVVLDRRVREPGIDSVATDSIAGARLLARHLLELGHRRIAVLTGRPAVSTSADRVEGVRLAFMEAGLPFDEALVQYGTYTAETGADGYRMTRRALALEPRPTAVFAANNFIAFGALRAIREAGLRVPEDLSVVTFDDLPVDWVADPILTVVAQPAYEIGRRAMGFLLERLAGESPARARHLLLPAQLIVRRSTAAPAPVTAVPTAGPAPRIAPAGRVPRPTRRRTSEVAR